MDSRFHADGSFEDVPFKPLTLRTRTLEHNSLRRRARRALPRLLVTLLAVPFLALPIIAWAVHGKYTPYQGTGWYLMKATEVAPTIFPMVFAAVLGMFLKSLAMRLAEKGCKLGTLEQLIGTSTTSSAVILPFTLHAFNTLTLILFLLFALSPLGSQATLRIISTKETPNPRSYNVSVLNPFSVSSKFAGQNEMGLNTLQADGLYAASVLAPMNIKLTPLDLWGNIKIPLLEHFETSNYSWIKKSEDGWYTDGPTMNGGPFSSLLGWPISDGKQLNTKNNTAENFTSTLYNTDFTIETGYWHINCTSLSTVTPDPCTARGLGITPKINGSDFASRCFNTSDFESDIYFPNGNTCNGTCLNIGYNQTYLQQNETSVDPLQLVLLTTDPITEETTVGECYLRQTFASANITCKKTDCGVNAVRRLNPSFFADSNKKNVTNILSGDTNLLNRMIKLFTTILEDKKRRAQSINTLYLMNPTDPYSAMTKSYDGTDQRLVDIGPQNLGIRLGQLLNTYYQSSGSAWSNPQRTARTGFEYVSVNKTIVMTTNGILYDASALWCGITFAASIMLITFGALSTVWAFTSSMPEMFGVGMFTSLLAESRHVRGLEDEEELSSRSLKDSDEKALLLKNRMVKIGDVRGNGDVGYISFGMSEAEIKRNKEEKHRLRQAVIALNSNRIYA